MQSYLKHYINGAWVESDGGTVYQVIDPATEQPCTEITLGTPADVDRAVEAARTFEENVVTDVREADVGSILGFGFAPFSGGTLSYIDMMGTKNFVMLCERLAKKYGPRFEPPKLLRDMAAKGESFYTRFAPGKKAA